MGVSNVRRSDESGEKGKTHRSAMSCVSSGWLVPAEVRLVRTWRLCEEEGRVVDVPEKILMLEPPSMFWERIGKRSEEMVMGTRRVIGHQSISPSTARVKVYRAFGGKSRNKSSASAETETETEPKPTGMWHSPHRSYRTFQIVHIH